MPAALWTRSPLLRLLLFFILGISAYLLQPDPLSPWGWPWLFPIWALLGCRLWVHWAWGPRPSPLRLGGMALLWWGLSGYALACTHAQVLGLRTQQAQAYFGQVRAYVVQVEEPAEEQQRWVRLWARGGAGASGARILLYLPRSEAALALRYGDRLLVGGIPVRVPPPANLGAFDYGRYLLRKGIAFRQYARHWRLLPQRGGNRSGHLFSGLRQAGQRAIGAYAPRSQGLVTALALGIRQAMPEEERRLYTDTGTMHAIAVSGMHLQVVVVWLGWLLAGWKGDVRRRRTYLPLAAVLAWGYTALSGACPSVLRAACMFSVLLLAYALRRRQHLPNTLAASALLLLLWDPFMLAEVGFQLSYLAVLGMYLLVPLLQRLWHPPWRWLDLCWQGFCATVAAQLFTMPLSAYYFHQLPLYFLLSNAWAIPLSTLLLWVGLLLPLSTPVPPVATALGQLAEWLADGMRHGLAWVAALPAQQWEGLSPWRGEVLGWYACLLWGVWVLRRPAAPRVAGLLLLLALQVGVVGWHRQQQHAQRLLVVHQGRGSALSYVQGRSQRSFQTLGPLAAGPAALAAYCGISAPLVVPLPRGALLWQLPDAGRVCWLPAGRVPPTIVRYADVLILSAESAAGYRPLPPLPRLLVLDASVGRWQVRRLAKLFPAGRLHIVSQQGCFVCR